MDTRAENLEKAKKSLQIALEALEKAISSHENAESGALDWIESDIAKHAEMLYARRAQAHLSMALDKIRDNGEAE